MRELVGLVDPAGYDNATGAPIHDVPAEAYRFFFDFGCGCGRTARRLLRQDEPPERYVGIDLHRGMIEWCQANLAPLAPGFHF